jgi:hypothetical protein
LMSSPTERPRPPRQTQPQRPFISQPAVYGGAPYLQTGGFPREKSGPTLKGGYSINVFNKREGTYSVNRDFERKNNPPRAQGNRGPPSPRRQTPRGGPPQQSFPGLFQRIRQGKSQDEDDEQFSNDSIQEEEFSSDY